MVKTVHLSKDLSEIATSAAEGIMHSLLDNCSDNAKLSASVIFVESIYIASYMTAAMFQRMTGQSEAVWKSSLEVLGCIIEDIAPGERTAAESAATQAFQEYAAKADQTKFGDEFPYAVCAVLFNRLNKLHAVKLEGLLAGKVRNDVYVQPEAIQCALEDLFSLEDRVDFKSLPPEFANQLVLFRRYEDGELTANEYFQGLAALRPNQPRTARPVLAQRPVGLVRIVAIAAVALVVGLALGPWLSNKVFGYSSFEECLLNAANRYQASACADLFPRKDK